MAGDLTFENLNVSISEGSNTAILTGDNTLMMIPQEFTSDNEKITIVFTDAGSTQHTLTCSLKDTSWAAGQIVTYSITTNGLVWEYVLEATGGSTSYAGGDVNFYVKSYRYKRTSPSTIENISWTIDGYKEDGATSFSATKPTWINSITSSGNGTTSTSGTNEGTANINGQTATTAGASFTSVERGTSSAPYDLSTHDLSGNTTTRNTANCYVVNAPGWYKIPLVYGNGIKNGSNNTSAYNSSSFRDYADNQIKNLTGPYLKYSGTIGTSGSGAPIIVWQDVNGMVTNLSVAETTTEGGYLKFYIAPNKIAEGNAVLAVNNSSGTIMWSWHIWVTATDITKTITITGYNTNYSYQLMPVNLGWVSTGTSTVYAGRGTYIRLKQTGSNKTEVFTILQNQYKEMSRLGDSPYYQWGRKDPYPGMSSSSNAMKSAWDNSGSAFTVSRPGTAVPLTTAIQNPAIFYGTTYSRPWCSTVYDDLWDVSTGNLRIWNYSNIVKSVYDPNPVGFKMPPNCAFTGTTSDNSTIHQTYGNVKGTFYTDGSTGAGTMYYTDPGKAQFFMPATGLMRSGKYIERNNYGAYWLPHPCASDGDGSAYYFYSATDIGKVGPGHGLERCAGMCIRSVTE